MPFKKGENGNARGGARPGAGRKPTAVTILKRKMIEDKVQAAEEAFAFLEAVRANEDEPTSLRVAAAGQILDRAWGKARQALELSGAGGEPIQHVVFYTPDNGRSAPAAG